MESQLLCLVAQFERRVSVATVFGKTAGEGEACRTAARYACAGRVNITLEWLSPLGHDEVYLDGLGTPHTPGSPTADDFCRRFAPEDIDALMEAIGVSRFRVWQEQPGLFFDEAVLDVDGTLVATPPRRRSVGAEARSREAGGAPDGVSNLRERLQSHSRLGGSFDEGDEWDRG